MFFIIFYFFNIVFIVFCQLGHAYILLSSIETNDDNILRAYDQGCKVLKRVLRQNPDNDKLRAQLQAMGVDENEEDEEYDDHIYDDDSDDGGNDCEEN